MFNNILYFIIVLLVFNFSYQESPPDDSLTYTLIMILLTWLVLVWYSRWAFQRLWDRFTGTREGDGLSTGEYHGLILRLSILAILVFALDVHLFHLKYWLQAIPGFKYASVLQGIGALGLFLGYLSTIWYFAYPVYQAVFKAGITRRSFIISNLKFNMPILFPWMALSFIHDLISLTPWLKPGSFLDRPEGQILFFASFLVVLMIFMPRFVQYWWGCKPFQTTEKSLEIEAFLRGRGLKYRHLLNWPVFEGRMLTAGIMGIVPRYRYILVTDALMEVLSTDELKAVMAHEMGHARHRHMLFYLFLFLGYMVISVGLFDIFFYFLAVQPFFMRILENGQSQATNLFYFVLSLPVLGTMFVYFRYVMGFFMRQFERQADLYSAVTMGSPRETISSLEKIAFLSGKMRDLPSWHHFSIKERVECLLKLSAHPGLVKRHGRFVALSLGTYLVSMVALSYFVYFSDMKQNLTYQLVGRVLDQQLIREPENMQLYQNLAMVYHKMGRLREAMEVYEKILDLDGSQTVALNNLAWFLVTLPDETLRDRARALDLAKKAVALKRSPIFLDTLAEAYYANGLTDEAVKTIKEAMSLATEGKEYYEKQLKRFTG